MKKYIVITFLALVALSGLSAQTLKPVSYADGSQQLNGLVSTNAGKGTVGVLILPAWKGIDKEAKDAAMALAKQGYVAFIADIYGAGNIPADNAAAAKIAGSYKSDFKAYQHRIALALEELKKRVKNPDKIAVIGYCFGGTGALEVARAGLMVKGVVCIHGGLAKAADRENVAIKTKVLVEHPAADGSVTKTDYDNLVKEMNEGGADWQIITYANCKHTFTSPESSDYNELMAKRAWAHTLLFLKEVLQ